MKNSVCSTAITFNEYKDDKTEIYYFGNDYGLFIDIDTKNGCQKIYIYKNKNIKTELFTIMEHDIENQTENHNTDDDDKDKIPYSVSIKMIIVAAAIFTTVIYFTIYIIMV